MDTTLLQRLLDEGRDLQARGGGLRPSQYRSWRDEAAGVSRALEQAGRQPLALSADALPTDLARIERLLVSRSSPSPDAGDGAPAAASATAPEAGPGAATIPTISVFVSHKMTEDRSLAGAIRNRLGSLSNRRVKALLAQGIPGAEVWQEWVEENVRKAHMLLFLHTSDDHDNDWLLYEAGLYRGSRDGDVHLVCIKNPDLDRPPPQLARLQAYEATEEGITQFLMDLLYRGVFSGGVRLNDAIRDEQEEDFQDAVREIVGLFAERQVSVTYFRTRLEVGPIPLEKGTDVDERLRRSEVRYNEATGALLGLPEVRKGEELTWSQVCEHFDPITSPWIQELEEVVRNIDERRYFSQVLSSFESVSGRRIFPVISRVERLKARPKSITIIFLERQPKSVPDERLSEPTAADSARSPEAFRAVVGLLNFARRFRWNVLSHYLAEFEGFRVAELDVGDLGRELRLAIESLEVQAGAAGYTDPAHVAAAFPASYRETIRGYFADYGEQRGRLMDAVARADREEIIAVLNTLSTLNKRFLLAGLNRYKQLIQELDPLAIADEPIE